MQGSRMSQEVQGNPAALIRMIESEADFHVLIWAAGALNACLLKRASNATYALAFDEFKQPEGMKYLPETWLQSDRIYESPPNDAVLVIAKRIEQINALEGKDEFNHEAMEACAWLLTSLLELVRDRRRQDGKQIRKCFVKHKTPPKKNLLQDCSTVSTLHFAEALISVMTKKDTDTDDITTNRDVAFISGSHLLAHLVEQDVEMARVLQNAKVPELICDRIFHKASLKPADLWRRKLPLRWEAFAAASCYFLQMFLEAHKGPITSDHYRMMNDAMFAVLDKKYYGKKAFGDPAEPNKTPFQSNTVHLELFGAFKVLKHIVDVAPGEAHYMIDKNGIFFATELLKIEGADLDSIRLGCDFITVLLAASGKPEEDAKAVDLMKVLDRMMHRYRQYPLGTTDLQMQCSKLRVMCGAPLSPLKTPRGRKGFFVSGGYRKLATSSVSITD